MIASVQYGETPSRQYVPLWSAFEIAVSVSYWKHFDAGEFPAITSLTPDLSCLTPLYLQSAYVHFMFLCNRVSLDCKPQFPRAVSGRGKEPLLISKHKVDVDDLRYYLNLSPTSVVGWLNKERRSCRTPSKFLPC